MLTLLVQAPTTAATEPTTSAPTLGARLRFASEATRKRLGVASLEGGLLLVDAQGGGPASKAGLRKDDVIDKIDDAAFKNRRGLVGELRKRRAGQEVRLAVWRQGHPLAVVVTLADARQLYEHGCEAGSPQACTDLGDLYGRGDGVPRDQARAAALYQRACDGGDADGCSQAGWVTERGLGTLKDEARAVAFYTRACDGGSPWGCGNLGKANAHGMSLPKDEARAAVLYKQACDAGDIDACPNLGWLYEKGRGVPTDEAQAASLYKESCDGGSAYGCGCLGVLHRDGHGVPKDLPQSVVLLKQGCDWGNARSCTNLGSLYKNGQGVPRDLVQARALYRKGCDQADDLGCTSLKNAGEDAQASAAMAPTEIFKRVSPSVVVVEILSDQGVVVGFGSGVVVGQEVVATNRHVVEAGSKLRVRRQKETWPARIDSLQATRDLARLAVPGLTAPAVSIRASATLEVGERVWAVGAPQGLELTLSEGLISGIRPLPGHNENVLQTTAAISPGSSGGGLFDGQGRLVGITSSYRREGQSLNFALPAEWAVASGSGSALPAPPRPSPTAGAGLPPPVPRDSPGARGAANGPLPQAALALPAQLGLLLGIDVKALFSSAEYRTLMAGEATGLPGLTGSQQNDVRDAIAEGLKEFEAQTGFSPERDLDRLVLGVGDLGAKEPSGACILYGRLDKARITRALQTSAPAGKTLSPRVIGGRSLYIFGRGQASKPDSAIVLLDDATLLFGTPSAVEATLMSHLGGRRSLEANSSLTTLVRDLDPGAGFWLALDSSATIAMHTAMIQRSAGPRPLVLPIANTMTVTARFGGGFEAVAEMADEATARNMADLIRGGLGALRLGVGQNPATVSAYKGWTDALDVSSEGKRVHLVMPPPLGGGVATGLIAAAVLPQIRGNRLSAAALAEESHGQWEPAIDHLKEAERLEPWSVAIKRELGSAFLRLRRYREAGEAIDKGLALEPTSLPLIEDKAMTSLGQGDLAAARTILNAVPNEVDPSALVAFVARYEDLVWALDEGQRERLLGLTPTTFGDDKGSWALCLTQAYALKGDMSRTRIHAEEARQAYEEQLRASPQDSERHVLLGLALAYLGRHTEAIAEGQRGVALLPVTKDARNGPYQQHQLARIYLLAGEPEEALDQLEPLLQIPYFLSPGWLRIDPTFEPLRKNPRFQKLLGEPSATPGAVEAVRVGGEIKEPRKLKSVNPVYPETAKEARIQGVVVLECLISPEGKVVDVKVRRGIPLLDDAAVEAVKQWVYTPTLVKGVPVPVIMTVTVNFQLSS